MTMWNEHVNSYRAKHPDMSYKQCLQNAAKTYKSGKKKSGVSGGKRLTDTELRLKFAGLPNTASGLKQLMNTLTGAYLKAKKGKGLKLAGEGTHGGALKLAGEGAIIKGNNPKMLEDAARIVVKYTKHLVSGDLAKLRDNLIKVYGDKLLRGKMHVGGSYGCGLGLAGGSVNWSALWAKALTLISQAPVKKIAKAGAALAGKQAKKLAKKALEDPEKAIDIISTGYDLGKSIKKKGIRNSGKEVAQI